VRARALQERPGEVKTVHARFRQEEAALLHEIFDDARKTGELASVDVDRVVGLVQRAYATLSPPWLFELSPDEAQRTAYEMCRLLLLGVTARRSPEGRTTTKRSPARRATRGSSR
jgi:hypothetical protein